MRTLIAAALLIAALAESQAHAQPVQWRAPPSCPTDIVQRIEHHLGGPLVAPGREPVHALIDVENSSDGTWRATVQTEGPGANGVRAIAGGSCEALTDAVALILAMVIDADAVAENVDRGRKQGRPPPPPPRIPRSRAPVSPRRARHLGWSLGLRAQSDVGGAPGEVPGIGVDAGLTLGRQLRFEVAASYWFAQQATLDDAPTSGADISLVALSASACWLNWNLRLCFGLEGGAMHGAGFGVREPSSGSALWLAGVAGVRKRFSFSKLLGMVIALDGLGAASRPRFLLQSQTQPTVYRPEIASIRAWFAIEISMR